jgi:Tfp pilus assembly protein PilF
MDATALFHEANRLLEDADLGGAEGCLRQALGSDPEGHAAWANLSVLYLSAQREDEAAAGPVAALHVIAHTGPRTQEEW